jgi:hypothetical protein
MDPTEAADLVAAFVETDGTEVTFSRITDATTNRRSTPWQRR